MNSLIVRIVFLVSCFFSMTVLAGHFEIKPFVDNCMPDRWQSSAGLFLALQAQTVAEAEKLVQQHDGIVELSAIQEVAASMLSEESIANYIQRKFSSSEQPNVKNIVIDYMKNAIQAQQGSIVEQQSLVEEMVDSDTVESQLSDREKYLAALLWSDKPRLEIAKEYKKKFHIGTLNTVYGHISLLYKKIPALKLHRRRL